MAVAVRPEPPTLVSKSTQTATWKTSAPMPSARQARAAHSHSSRHSQAESAKNVHSLQQQVGRSASRQGIVTSKTKHFAKPRQISAPRAAVSIEDADPKLPKSALQCKVEMAHAGRGHGVAESGVH